MARIRMRHTITKKTINVESEAIMKALLTRGWEVCEAEEKPTKERKYYTPTGFGQR